MRRLFTSKQHGSKRKGLAKRTADTDLGRLIEYVVSGGRRIADHPSYNVCGAVFGSESKSYGLPSTFSSAATAQGFPLTSLITCSHT